jgi:hypothetical protein
MRCLISAICVLTAAVAVAHAEPPPPGSEDAEMLGPYSAAISDARRDDMPNYKCCDIGDGTVVDARIAGDRWQVKFRDHARFPDAPTDWTDVPPEAVLHRWHNPTGNAIIWWLDGHIRCFAQPKGV